MLSSRSSDSRSERKMVKTARFAKCKCTLVYPLRRNFKLLWRQRPDCEGVDGFVYRSQLMPVGHSYMLMELHRYMVLGTWGI